METLELKTLSWVFKDCVSEATFLLSGISDEDESGVTRSTQVKIRGFRPFCYVELPGGVAEWITHPCSKHKQTSLLKHINTFSKRKAHVDDHYKFAPALCADYVEKYDLYGKVPKAYLYLEFRSLSDVRAFANFMVKKQIVKGYHGGHSCIFGAKEFSVHEHNIDPIIHFSNARNLNLVGWVRIDNALHKPCAENDDEEVDDNPAFTQVYECHYEDVHPVVSEKVKFPKYISFDFECDSENHNAKLPDPNNPKNAIRHIGIVIGRFGNPDRKYILLSLGKTIGCANVEPLAKEGYMRKQDYRSLVQDISFNEEREELLEFLAIIRRENPDVMLGYNTMKFDWEYLIARATLLGILSEVFRISRFPDTPAKIGEMRWQSSAYGEQKAQFVDIPGRVNVDVMMEVQRNYKLSSYGLDVVAEFFLKQKKEDVSPSQMFMIFRFFDYVNKTKSYSTIMRNLEMLFPTLRTFGFLAETKEEMKVAKSWKDLRKISKRLLTMVGYYCVIDCILPLDVCDQLNLWLNMEQMAEIFGVPTSYLHPRGQQVKVLAQLYPIAKSENVIIPYHKHNDTIEKDKKKKYQGAVVIEALPGVYIEVDLDDFESLYPSEIISNNICYTTFLNPKIPEHASVTDAECVVIEWESHIGCEHDTEKRKTKIKPENVLCGAVKHRFRRVEYCAKQDGTMDITNEGLISKLERNLLSKRKIAKKELAKCKAKLSMHLGKATSSDIEGFKETGYDIIEKGILSPEQEIKLRVYIVVMDAKQNALKIGANSVAPTTPIPCLINGKFCYRSIEQLADGKWETTQQCDEIARPIPNLLVWSDAGFTEVAYVFRHKTTQQLTRVMTNHGCVDVTDDHSLLTPDGTELSTKHVQIGDELMHFPVPLPQDTPSKPLYESLTNESVLRYIESLGESDATDQGVSQSLACVWGYFFAEGTCGVYETLHNIKSSWIIYNQNLEFQKVFCNLLDKCHPEYKFKISTYNTSPKSLIYHLSPRLRDGNTGNVTIKSFVEKYRTLFYDQRKYKIIPDEILCSSFAVRQAFFMGYYAGDGSRTTPYILARLKGSTGSAQLFHLMKSVGYEHLTMWSDLRNDVYSIRCVSKYRLNPDKIKKIAPTPQIRNDDKLVSPLIRNTETISVTDDVCMYRSIKIHCKRVPRQKLLDSLDVALDSSAHFRGNITQYWTKTKRVEYQCCTCHKVSSAELRGFRDKNSRIRNCCSCSVKYDPLMNQHTIVRSVDELSKDCFVYDIETVSHHFAGGVGDLIVHNSAYGGLGAQTGYAPFIEGAACVTACGRKHLTKSKQYANEKYDATVIYGDSVTGDTPILIRKKGEDCVKYVTAEELFHMGTAIPDDRGKEFCLLDEYECWSDKGFTPVKNMVRHYTTKHIFRVKTYGGEVDVTQDHSLLLENETVVRPTDVKPGDKLLWAYNGHLSPRGGTNSVYCENHLRGECVAGYCTLRFNSLQCTHSIFPRDMATTVAKYCTRGDPEEQKNVMELLCSCSLCFVHDVVAVWTREIQGDELRKYTKPGPHQWSKLIRAYISLHGWTSPGKTFETSGWWNTVRKIQDLGVTTDWVYDLETENHHYVAGIGGIVVHNTDSIMTTYKNPVENPFARQVRVARAITHHLKCDMLGLHPDTPLENITGLDRYKYDALPLNLQPESRMKKLILLTKKRYMALLVDARGNITEVKKGTVEVKRDNCSVLKSLYKTTRMHIFNDSPFCDAQQSILNEVIRLATRQMAAKNMVIYKAIGKFEKYAKKEEGTDKRILSKKLDCNGNIVPGQPGLPSCSDDPLDWFYEKPQAHVHLALKMLERGDRVPPNTRMEYVFTKGVGELPDPEATQRDKIEDYTYFVEHSDILELDIPYYILHQLARPISELLRLGWPDIRRYRNSLDPTPENLEASFAKLPNVVRTAIGRKRGIKTKVLHFLNNYGTWMKEHTIVVGSSAVVPNEISECLELCREWYLGEKMSYYYFKFGVAKNKRVRKRNKKVHPFIMDILQTVVRHSSVIQELNTEFRDAFGGQD